MQLKICKAFCQTPRYDFDFDDEIWFENRSLRALDINIVAKKMKEISKATSLSHCTKAGVQNRHIMAISVHSNEHSLVSCNKRLSEDQLIDGILVPHPSSHFRNRQSHSDSSEFSY